MLPWCFAAVLASCYTCGLKVVGVHVCTAAWLARGDLQHGLYEVYCSMACKRCTAAWLVRGVLQQGLYEVGSACLYSIMAFGKGAQYDDFEHSMI